MVQADLHHFAKTAPLQHPHLRYIGREAQICRIAHTTLVRLTGHGRHIENGGGDVGQLLVATSRPRAKQPIEQNLP